MSPLIAGFFAPWLIAAGVLVQALLLAQHVVGYARDDPPANRSAPA